MRSGEALAQAATQLENNGVESPRFDAELLMAHVLEANRAAVLAHLDQLLTPKQLTRFRNLVARRAGREPLAYIVGHREFYDLDLAVDARVLIPRPETELLVEVAIHIARAQDLARGMPRPLSIADVGSGSGAIAVTLAVHLPEATVYALDDSADALAVTAENARRCGVGDRVRCLQGDLLSPLAGSRAGALALITANLPYIATSEWQTLPPEIRDHEPRTALDGGPDGLDAIRRLLATAGHLRTPAGSLRPGGAILLEIGASQGAAVTALARQHFSQAGVRLVQDYAGLDRLVVVET